MIFNINDSLELLIDGSFNRNNQLVPESSSLNIESQL